MDSVVSLPVAFSFFFRLPHVSVLSGGSDAAAHHSPASAAGRKRGGTPSHEAAPGPREARLRPRVPPGAAGPLGPGSSGRRLTRSAHGGPQGPAGGPAASGRRAVSEHQPDGEPKWRVGRGHTLPRARGPRPRTQLVPSHLDHAWQAGDLNLGPPGCCPPLDHTATPVFQPSLVGCRPRGAGVGWEPPRGPARGLCATPHTWSSLTRLGAEGSGGGPQSRSGGGAVDGRVLTPWGPRASEGPGQRALTGGGAGSSKPAWAGPPGRAHGSGAGLAGSRESQPGSDLPGARARLGREGCEV